MPKFMPTSLFFTWVKNVYSLRTPGGTNSDYLYTDHLLAAQFTKSAVHNPQVTPLFVQALATQLSTAKNDQLHLLYSRLYPQSTPPINKKKKIN